MQRLEVIQIWLSTLSSIALIILCIWVGMVVGPKQDYMIVQAKALELLMETHRELTQHSGHKHTDDD